MICLIKKVTGFDCLEDKKKESHFYIKCKIIIIALSSEDLAIDICQVLGISKFSNE